MRARVRVPCANCERDVYCTLEQFYANKSRAERDDHYIIIMMCDARVVLEMIIRGTIQCSKNYDKTKKINLIIIKLFVFTRLWKTHRDISSK